MLLPEGTAQKSAFTKGQIGNVYFSARDYQIYLCIYVLAEANRVIQETQQFVQQITPAIADLNLSKSVGLDALQMPLSTSTML